MKIKNYYTVLGLDPSASQEEVKKAYKIYASKFHPDKHQGDKFFEEKFKEIGEAYEFLSNPLKRKILDDQLDFRGSNNTNEPKTGEKENFTQKKSNPSSTDDIHRKNETAKEKFNREMKEKRKRNFLIGLGTTAILIFLMEVGGKNGWHVPIAVFFMCWTIRQAFLVVVSLMPD